VSSQSAGGLELLDIEARNKCFLAKQLWNIHKKSDSLWIRWVDHFYLPHNSIWPLEMQKSFSPLWKSICSLKSHLIAQLGGFRMLLILFRVGIMDRGLSLPMLTSSFGLKEILSAGIVWSRSSGPYHGTILFYNLLS
jgi:hypothetical protein